MSDDEPTMAAASSTAAAAAAPSSATKPSSSSNNGQEIISLLDDDDFCRSDDEADAIDRAMRASLHDSGGSASANSRAAKRQRRKASPRGVNDSMSSAGGGVISLLSDSDSDDGGVGKAGAASASAAGASSAFGGSVKREAKREGAGGLLGGRMMNDDNDDEVVEVAPQEPVFEQLSTAAGASSAARKTTGEDDDEIEAIGTSNVLRLPHARHDCTQHTFVQDVLHKKTRGLSQAARDGLDSNKKCCELCYCFVCDIPASECKSWAGSALTPSGAHCLASNSGINAVTWTRLRDEKKNGTSSSGAASSSAAAASSGVPSGSAAVLQAIIDARRARAGRSLSASSAGRRGSSWGSSNRRLQDQLESLYGSRPGGSQSRAQRVLAALAGRGFPPSPPSSPTPAIISSSARHAIGKGPFKPDDQEAAKCNTLTQCRRCKWRSAFDHRNYTRKQTIYRRGSNRVIPHPHEVGEQDWCHACGRIASTKDHGKEQAVSYTPLATDVCLGTKTIAFTIKSHDPRKLDAFKDRWKEFENKPGWKYDEAEMQYDTFRHRIGSRPTLDMIMASIPIVPEEDIPETGYVDNPVNKDSSFGWSPSRSRTNNRRNAANECEALLLESSNHTALFAELKKFGGVLEKKADDSSSIYGNDNSNNVMRANITAKWDKTRQTGTVSVTLFLRQRAFEPRRRLDKSTAGRFSLVLGCWFDIFPFQLAELTVGLKPNESNLERRKEWGRYGEIPIHPFRLDEDERTEYCEVTNEEKTALRNYKPKAKAITDKLSFLSSTGSSYGGGVSNNDSSLSGTLRRFFGEKLIDDSQALSGSTNLRVRLGWMGKQLNITSHHRDMRKKRHGIVSSIRHRDPPDLSSYLRSEDHALLVENVSRKTKSIYERTQTFPGLMQHLENLGHKASPQPDGINVELLDFQKEALGWAIERENNAGGLQSFLWVELPRQANGVRPGYSNKLYFSPVLDMFVTQKPDIARGGFICEQMGLGKTVISLSLVLQNPAPEFPEFGTEVSGYQYPPNQETTDPGWTQVVKKAADAPTTRGSIFSRGTLVVCNVSLVGQWIDEAKSKLKNPGLVYSYHGGSRTRDASILAQKSIVVTTYSTLSSDATYHAKKSKNSDVYCAPCEQVRWWRIICDESHVLRANSGNTKATLRLQAENKWCVTGTPINTTVMDLKNQLSFIGLDKVEAMFTMFANNMGHHNGKALSGRRRRRSWDKSHEIGPFMFLMRSLLIRHTMEQKCRQSKRDLMSLPEKTERVIKIPFTADERTEYDKLETAARNAYTTLKAREGSQLSRHYLKLHSFLLPLRTACSGGKLPEDDPFEDNVDEDKNKVHQMQPGDDIECSICLDTLDNPRATQCKPVPHVFCKECIEGVIGVNDDSSNACPICRETVVAKKLCKAILPKIEKDEDEAAIGEDCTAVFKTKFTRLIAELKKIRDTEPNAKSLVFSQFTSTLEWLKQELPKQGFQFRTLSGDMAMSKRAKALREFQNDPPTTIFLLSMRAGAVGINLTQANRVFLMEPALNPALEAQAIGRVHRLGQRHKVEVLRLIMEDSVETRMMKLSKKKYGSKADSSDDGNGDDEDEDGTAAAAAAASPASASSSSKKKKKKKQDPPSSRKKSAKKKSHKDAPDSVVAIGSLRKDKAQMAAEEFDLLFGLVTGDDANESGGNTSGDEEAVVL